jgi:hypothetical protein
MKKIGSNQAGKYATSTLNHRSWISTKSAPQKGKKNKSHPQIVNEIFEECINLETDPFWVSTFHRLAIGKFPRGFTYKDNILQYKKGKKSYKIEVPKVSYEAHIECKSFFQRVDGQLSQLDQDEKRNSLDTHLQEMVQNQYSTWGAVKKKKSVFDSVISNFLDELEAEFHLDHYQRLDAGVVIHTGLILGQFTSKDVNYERGKILNINGLLYDPNSKKFYTNNPIQINKVKKQKEDRTNKKQSSANAWTKYVDNFEKQIISNCHETSPKLNVINHSTDTISIPSTDTTEVTE